MIHTVTSAMFNVRADASGRFVFGSNKEAREFSRRLHEEYGEPYGTRVIVTDNIAEWRVHSCE